MYDVYYLSDPKHHKQLSVHPFNALIFPILRDCLQSVCIFLSLILLWWFFLFYVLVFKFFLCCWRLMYVFIFLIKLR